LVIVRRFSLLFAVRNGRDPPKALPSQQQPLRRPQKDEDDGCDDERDAQHGHRGAFLRQTVARLGEKERRAPAGKRKGKRRRRRQKGSKRVKNDEDSSSDTTPKASTSVMTAKKGRKAGGNAGCMWSLNLDRLAP
jgi:hypothetical protein